MRVLRIAHKAEGFSGDGMYCSGLWSCASGYAVEASGRHPMPYEDTLLVQDAVQKEFLYASDRNRYGFLDSRQLRSWLYDGELCQRLEDAGAVVFVLEVPELQVAVGNSQIVFNPHLAELVREASLVELFNGE